MKNEYRLLLLLVLNIITMAWVSQRFILAPARPAAQVERPQFAVICNAPGSEWVSLCRGVERAAEERGVAVEYIISAFSGEEADSSSIHMAAESNVNGIAILQTSGETGEAIAYAEEKGIPVVTMVYDELKSEMDTFVGVDNDTYGQFLLEAMGSFDADIKNVGLIYGKGVNQGRVETIENILRQRFKVQSASRATPHIFDTSAALMEFYMDHRDIQVICCMDDNTTQGVAQAVLDWNMVDQLRIVGFGSSENILSMVEKGVVAAAICTDYECIGEKAIFTLDGLCSGKERAPQKRGDALYIVTEETVEAYKKERGNGT